MSRRDNYHDIVKEALIREGWTITHDPYKFQSSPERTTDLGAEKPIAAERGNEKIAVEIKSFLSASRIVDLEKQSGSTCFTQHCYEDKSRTAHATWQFPSMRLIQCLLHKSPKLQLIPLSCS